MAGVAGAGALAGAGLAGRGDRRSNGNIYANGGGNGPGNGYPNPSPYNNQGRSGGIEDEDDGMGGRLGGTAEVRSAPGEGTEVELVLPRTAS